MVNNLDRASYSPSISIFSFQYYSASAPWAFLFTLLPSGGQAGKDNFLWGVGNAAKESRLTLNFTVASSKVNGKLGKGVYSL